MSQFSSDVLQLTVTAVMFWKWRRRMMTEDMMSCQIGKFHWLFQMVISSYCYANDTVYSIL